EFYTQRGYDAIPRRGPLSAITVPGAVDAWWQAHQRFGQLSWQRLLQPAIELAAQGYPVSNSQVYWTRQNQTVLAQYPGSQRAFLSNNGAPARGSTVQNPDLANTLQCLAAEGRDSFYRGAIAHEIIAGLQDLGGLLSLADFESHQSTWVAPITATYRGYTVYEMPPNTQGMAVLQMLNLIEPFDLTAMGHGSADYYHLMVEATKLAFADRDRWVTDPNFADIPVDQLISKSYSDRRRHRINLSQAQNYRAGVIGGDTTYSAVVDAEGNAVSMIQSLYFDFGSGVVPGNTGLILQNRGSFFSLDSAHINCLAPGKRTFHTLIPAMVTQANGQPYLVLGTMGGEGQPQTQLAMLTRMLDYDFEPQTAIDLPRWRWGRTWGDRDSGLTLEGRIAPSVQDALSSRGHSVTLAPNWSENMGHAHLIRIDPDTRTLQGGCDCRSDGQAMGW
ncbi:MAG: gamma-glutamyltransferase, partial [Cyanobacteria bacterium P01_D01_bin.128]